MFRNYMHDNALYMIDSNFDAKYYKIRNVTQLEVNTDAVNKQYLEQCISILKVQQQEFEKKLSTFQSNVNNLIILQNDVRQVLHVLNPHSQEEDYITDHSSNNNLVKELHASARRNFPRRRVIVHGYEGLWQTDMVEMRPYSRFNEGYHYILTVTDALSKYAWVVPLKTKNGFEVAKAFAKVIRDRCPKNLQTDQEKKFYNADVQRFLKKHNINQYSTYSVMKASIEERFNRTLKHHIWKLFVLIGTYRWIDALPNLVAEYNIRKHRTIRMRPCGVAPTIAGWCLCTRQQIQNRFRQRIYTILDS
ncbi:uncharacterized protein LOC143187729 [Calliopsis andreniformis]|uniref:uncharacterized protein LOC143187729 n=1 Tax=Calliopsis andreniformis TaxID=337506 RepID=UPI003FCEA7DF